MATSGARRSKRGSTVLIGLVRLVVGVVFGIDLSRQEPLQNPNLDVLGSSVGIRSAACLFVVGDVILLRIILIVGGLRRKGSRAVGRRRDRQRTTAAVNETETV